MRLSIVLPKELFIEILARQSDSLSAVCIRWGFVSSIQTGIVHLSCWRSDKSSMSHPLFSPFRLRSVSFANRIGVSPMCQYSSEDGFAND
jgi:hypothetical protein